MISDKLTTADMINKLLNEYGWNRSKLARALETDWGRVDLWRRGVFSASPEKKARIVKLLEESCGRK